MMLTFANILLTHIIDHLVLNLIILLFDVLEIGEATLPIETHSLSLMLPLGARRFMA